MIERESTYHSTAPSTTTAWDALQLVEEHWSGDGREEACATKIANQSIAAIISIAGITKRDSI